MPHVRSPGTRSAPAPSDTGRHPADRPSHTTQGGTPCPPLSRGIQNSATLYFFPTYSDLHAWAVNVGGLNFDGITVIAQIPFSDFPKMYDLLRNEAPVQLYYTYGSSSTTTKPVNLVSIERGNEPPGEGPQDEDAVESAIRGFLAARTIELGKAAR